VGRVIVKSRPRRPDSAAFQTRLGSTTRTPQATNEESIMRLMRALLCTVTCLTVTVGCTPDTAVSPDDVGLLFAPPAQSSAPSNFSVTTVSSAQVQLAWRGNTSNHSGYEIHRTPLGGGQFTLLAVTAADAASYSDLGLTASSQYCYQVRAFKRTGKLTVHGVFSQAVCAMTLPPSPSNTTAIPTSSHVVHVGWVATFSAGIQYRIERSASSEGPWSLAATTNSPQEYVDAGRASETQVCYRVTVVISTAMSAPSNVDCTSPPAAPVDLTATSTADRTIDITWSDQSAVEDGYEIQRAKDGQTWAVLATVPANVASYQDRLVSSDTGYSYRVRAMKDGGFSDFSNLGSAVSASAPPVAPTDTRASALSSTSVHVTYTDVSRNEAGFHVERSIDGRQTWQAAGSVGASGGGQQFFDDVARQAEQEVCYRVRAFNAKGESDPSNVSCTTPPAGPTNLTAVTLARQQIELRWTNNSPTADGVIVQRVYEPYYYYYYYDTSYVTIATLPPSATSYVDFALYAGEFATYRVVAVKDGGWSDPSNLVGISSELPPPAPSGLTASAPAAGRIDLAWTYGAAEPDYFSIQRCRGTTATCDDGDFVRLDEVYGSSRTFSDVQSLPGETFTYRVRAIKSGAVSPPSNEASATFR
jgi:titin